MSTTQPAPLLERDDERDVIEELIDRVSEPRGAAVVIDGPPGIGKTALLAAAAAHAGASGLRVLRARGLPLEQTFAFGVARQALEHARVLADLGEHLRRTGRRTEAREPLRRALDLSHRCGATHLAADVTERLRTAGGRPRRPFLTGADALTPAERRIAVLAAAGRSNREIAQALFITLNTVESHLRHVFRKLDVANRAEIAAKLAEP